MERAIVDCRPGGAAAASDRLVDTLLFVLLLLALAGGASAIWWLSGRLHDLEERLQSFAHLSLVPDRLQALARVIEGLDAQGLREDVESVRAALRRVEDLVAAPAAAASPAPEPPLAARLRAAIQRRLREEGYEAVNVVDEDAQLAESPARVRVEARRRGQRILGNVTLEGERVVEIDLSPSFTMFP